MWVHVTAYGDEEVSDEGVRGRGVTHLALNPLVREQPCQKQKKAPCCEVTCAAVRCETRSSRVSKLNPHPAHLRRRGKVKDWGLAVEE